MDGLVNFSAEQLPQKPAQCLESRIEIRHQIRQVGFIEGAASKISAKVAPHAGMSPRCAGP